MLTLLCAGVLGVGLALLLRADIRERALEDAREQAGYMAVAVAVDLLTKEELDAGLDLRTLAAMDEAVAGHRRAGEIVTAKLFDRAGRLAYSPERDQLDEDGGDNVREALDGKVVAELEVGSEHVDELGGGLYEVYVPVRFAASERPSGVFEIYLPYAPVAARI